MYHSHEMDMRTEELNNRLFTRNVPSTTLQSTFDCRPINTKYSCQSFLDKRPQSSVPIVSYPTFDIVNTFNPGTAQAPWQGFVSHINDESTLRNQFYALQKSDQAYYIPATTSDLYVKSNLDNTDRPFNQPFPLLFVEQPMTPFNPISNGNTGKLLFENHTRQQMK